MNLRLSLHSSRPLLFWKKAPLFLFLLAFSTAGVTLAAPPSHPQPSSSPSPHKTKTPPQTPPLVAHPPVAGLPFDDRELEIYLENEARKLLTANRIHPLTFDRHSCAIALRQPANEKITWPAIAAHATAATLVIGEFSRSKKSKTLSFNFTAGAFVIEETGICVTSHHVAKERNSRGLVAMTRDGQVFPVKSVLATDQVNDLIIIQLDLPPSLHLPALALATAPAPVGSSIGVISHPNGQFYLFTSGQVARYALWRDPAGDQSFMSVTADFAKGSSGCAVLDDHGAVVGVVNNTESIYYEDDGEKKQQDLQMVVKNATPITLLRKMISPPTPIPPP
jgi:S1-C subfamily serine protease